MNRQWLRWSLLLACVVQVFSAWNSCQADDQAAAEKLLPKDTLAFFSFPDIPELKSKWGDTSFGKLTQDPKLQPFIADLMKKKDELSKSLEGEIGVSIDELLNLPQGELTIALMEKPVQKLAVVLMLDYGDSQETADKLIKQMDEALEKSGAEETVEEIEEIKVHIYKLKADDDNPIESLVYFTDESYFVISNELDAIKAVLERWEGDSDDTLADNDEYKYVMEQCKLESGEPAYKIFLSPTGLIQTGISMIQTSVPQAGLVAGFLPLLGIDGLKGFGVIAGFSDGDYEMVGNTYVNAESSKGLMGLFSFPATELAPPKWVPASVATYMIANWNVSGAYKSIEQLADSVQGPGSTSRLLDSLAESPPMIHIKKDLLDHLDGKLHFVQSAPKESQADAPPIPMILLAFGLKDAAKMKKTLAAAAKAGAGSVDTREFNGETIYEIGQGDDQPFSLAIAEGQLLFTNDTPLLEGIMRGDASRTASLIDSAEFKRVAKSFPSKTSIQMFARSDVQYKVYYDMLKKLDKDSTEGIDFSKLPSFDVIAKYLAPSASYAVPDKKGVKFVSFTLKRSE